MRLGLETPQVARRSLMDLIESGALERNEATLQMAADELQQRSLDADQTPEEGDQDRIAEFSTHKRDPAADIPDSFPWINPGELGQVPAPSKREAAADVPDSFPWINPGELGQGPAPSKREANPVPL